MGKSVEEVGMEGEMDNGNELDGDRAKEDLLPRLSATGLETLLASLDQRLDGFGAGPSCLDDALAYLNRLASSAGDGDSGQTETGAMVEWIEMWRRAGGNRATLRIMVQIVLAERMSLEG
ncbi:MAG: hypothetical protein VKL58_04830 [Cyanobacteriota bacterium]|nr:hypothetical protein [Cyanobacteriota bacterium]